MIHLSSLPQSYDHIVTTMLSGKETLVLEEVTSTLLSNKIRKRPKQKEKTGLGLVVTRKRRKGKFGLVKGVTFVTRKVIRRMIASIGKSG